jgi:conjugative relaxase-like TrwC/TraI family protein
LLVVLTIHRGHSVKYLTREVATGRENYYTGAVTEGEPPGRWYGAGAEALGLMGLVDHQDMEALYEHFVDPRDPAFKDRDGWTGASTLGHGGRKYKTAEQLYAEALDAEPYASPERREQLRLDAAKNERKNVAFYDVTFSVQKSITVLHAAFEHQEVQARRAGDTEAAAAWAAHKNAVEDAIWAGQRAGMDYLAEHAGYSRVGHHGGAAGRFSDAHGLIVASFFQHTSRANDPHLHIHGAILNRVQGADGQWRTLDGRSLYVHKPAAAAVAERTATEYLARSMRVLAVMRPDGKAREILDVPEAANKLLSTRDRAITPKTAELVAVFEQRYGRAPNALERDRLNRKAWAITRPRKSHDGETLEQRLDRVAAQLHAELNLTFETIAGRVLGKAGHDLTAQEFSPTAVVETALADVQARKASWTEADLAGAINDALPDYLGGLDARDVTDVIRGLTVQAIEAHAVTLSPDGPGTATLPDELRLANGASSYLRPGERLYATEQHVRSERALRAAAIERTAAALPAERAAAFLDELADSGVVLGVDQAAAVRGVLTSGAAVESLVGPAGTGKSFVVGAIARAWQDHALWDGQRRKVVGLATSQIASMVLTGEGLTARNIAQWRAVQERLAEGRPFGDDADWRLNPGDLVVVDESAMTDHADLAAVHQIAEQAGAKVLQTGDHRQLAAVGAAGGMDMIARVSPVYELTEARRFSYPWERDASLRLREGDDTALQDYRKHGRIIDGGTIERAERLAAQAWLADYLAGRRSLLIVDTNEQAARISAQIRARLVRLGHVQEHGVALGLQQTTAGVGDIVQGRRNGWELRGVDGNRHVPVNREQYRVLETRSDGGLVVAPIVDRSPDGERLGERITLPGSYVRGDLALSYASTVHAAEGLTVDTSQTVATDHTGRAALYVAVTRARDRNTIHVVTQAAAEDAPTGTVNQTARRDPLGVLAANMERDEPELAAIIEAEQNDTDAGSLRTIGERFADVTALATAGRTATLLDRLVHDGVLSRAQRVTLAADEGTVSLARVLRQAELAGHDAHTVLHKAVTSRDLADARSLASVLHQRITDTTDLHPKGDSYTDWTPKVDDRAWQRHIDDLATRADQRRAQLAAELVDTQPRWAIEAFGDVPDDHGRRGEWISRAATVAAHRELTGHDDTDRALPGPPKPGQVETYASWRAAWRALGYDGADHAEAEMSDGQLRVRVRALQREEAWAPDYVAADLSGTLQAAQRHHSDAELRAAEAANETDQQRKTQLEREAAQSRALADLLDRQAAQLEKADEIRGQWYLHTSETRAAALRARHELGERGITPDTAEDVTNADHWLTDQHAGQAEDDQHRHITDEHDLTDHAEARRAAHTAAEPTPSVDAAETNVSDIRQQADHAPKRTQQTDDDWTRVPTPADTADTITRAQRALAELEARIAEDQRRNAEDARQTTLTRWNTDDRTAERRTADRADRHADGRD